MTVRSITDEFLKIGKTHGFQKKHALRVAHFSLVLFDQLQDLHRMGNTERLWLWFASLMHDVGKNENRRKHHKIARDVLINSKSLPFCKKERIIIGMIARYHRGALPKNTHRYYRGMDSYSKAVVTKMAALLRLADGLDKNRNGLVIDINCELFADDLILQILSEGELNISSIKAKSDLFKKVYNKDLILDIEIDDSYYLALDTETIINYAFD